MFQCTNEQICELLFWLCAYIVGDVLMFGFGLICAVTCYGLMFQLALTSGLGLDIDCCFMIIQ